MQQIRLERWHYYFIATVFFLTWSTGAIWLLDELFKSEPFDLETKATLLQIKVISIHGAVSLLFVWGVGSLLLHIRQGWDTSINRFSGGALLLSTFVLMCTGWGLYYFVNESWRAGAILLHLLFGLPIPGILVAHAFLRRFRLSMKR